MAAIRPIDVIARKWATVTPQRAADYEAGIQNPGKDWATETGKAEASWKDGVAKAATAGSFGKGVSRAGTSGWQEGSLLKGVPRWGPGVALAEDKYLTGFSPYREAISRVVLPPRFARRDPRNLLRVAAIVDVMVKTKAAQG